MFEIIWDTALYTEPLGYAVEHLGQCCGPGVPKLEWHHHHYGPIMNQLQCTYGGQLHYGIWYWRTLDQRSLKEHGYSYCR